jgi:hypothetical protein
MKNLRDIIPLNESDMGTTAIQGFSPVMKFKQFDVDSVTFNKFQKGKVKFERWSNYLGEKHSQIKEYALTNPKSTIILRNVDTGALRKIVRRLKEV